MLESKMKLYGNTSATLAKYMGIRVQIFTTKKNENKDAEFTTNEIKSIKARYKLTPIEIDEIFLIKKVLLFNIIKIQ